MFGKKLILVIAIIFVLNVSGAPLNESACANIFLNKNLTEKYSDSLLKYSNDCNKTSTDALCSLYCDHVKQMFDSGKNVTKQEIDEVIKKQTNQSDFCSINTNLQQKMSIPEGTKLVDHTTNCLALCMHENKPKPLCSILSLILTKESKEEKTASNDVEQRQNPVNKTQKSKDQVPPVKTVPIKNVAKPEVPIANSEVKAVENPEKHTEVKLIEKSTEKSTEKPNEIVNSKNVVAPGTLKTEKEIVMVSSTVKISLPEDNEGSLEADGDDDNDSAIEDDKMLDLKPKEERPDEVIEKKPEIEQVSDPFYEESGSNFFTYFLLGMFISILLYVCYHNKAKLFGLILEGRRSQKRRTGSRRKHTAAYRKLDSNLEEAMTSSTSGRSSQIIY